MRYARSRAVQAGGSGCETAPPCNTSLFCVGKHQRRVATGLLGPRGLAKNRRSQFRTSSVLDRPSAGRWLSNRGGEVPRPIGEERWRVLRRAKRVLRCASTDPTAGRPGPRRRRSSRYHVTGAARSRPPARTACAVASRSCPVTRAMCSSSRWQWLAARSYRLAPPSLTAGTLGIATLGTLWGEQPLGLSAATRVSS